MNTLFTWTGQSGKKAGILILCTTVFLLLSGRLYSEEDFYSRHRKKMVQDQIVKRGVTSEAVVNAMLKVKREEFVPAGLKMFAYHDGPLSIGEGQTISQPYIVALMTQLLKPQPSDRILEVGTGSGYQAAVLAEIVKEVYSIEIIKSLAERAEKTLKRLRYKNVSVKWGDGFLGWEEYQPFDKIIITCSVEDFPSTLVEQLKEGGIIVAPVDTGLGYQNLAVGIKSEGRIAQRNIIPCRFVPATHQLR